MVEKQWKRRMKGKKWPFQVLSTFCDRILETQVQKWQKHNLISMIVIIRYDKWYDNKTSLSSSKLFVSSPETNHLLLKSTEKKEKYNTYLTL